MTLQLNWDRNHLLRIDDLSRNNIDNISELADILEPYSGIDKSKRIKKLDICRNHLVCLWFESDKEKSTRTYGSSQTGIVRLGGTYKTFDELMSSMGKEESVEDTARILSGQCDIIVDRHRDPLHVLKVAQNSLVPVLNAGNGSDQHPSQTILDIHTIKKSSGEVDGKTIAIVGDAKYGRTAHSLMRGLEKYEGIKVYGIVPEGLGMPQEFKTGFYEEVVISMEKLNKTLWDLGPLDYIYAMRTQEERLPIDQDPKRFSYIIDIETMSKLANTKILHPLPRVREISPELDKDPRALYFKQADYGIPIRMGILVILLRYEQEVLNLRN